MDGIQTKTLALLEQMSAWFTLLKKKFLQNYSKKLCEIMQRTGHKITPKIIFVIECPLKSEVQGLKSNLFG